MKPHHAASSDPEHRLFFRVAVDFTQHFREKLDVGIEAPVPTSLPTTAMLLEDRAFHTSLDDRVVEVCTHDPRLVPFLCGLGVPDDIVTLLPRRHLRSRKERDVLTVHAGTNGVSTIAHLEWLSRPDKHMSTRMLGYGAEAIEDVYPAPYELHQTVLHLHRPKHSPRFVEWPDSVRPLRVAYTVSGLNDFEAVDALIDGPALACALVPAMKGGSEPSVLRRSLVRLLNLPLATWLRRRFVALHCALAELSSIPHELWRDIAMTIDPTLLELDPDDPVAKGLQFIRDNAARVALAKVEAQTRAREREAEAREREAEAREREAILAIARRMLARNVDPALVAEDCQLPIDTVLALSSD